MDIWLMKAGGVSNLAIHLMALNLYLETLSIVQVLSRDVRSYPQKKKKKTEGRNVG